MNPKVHIHVRQAIPQWGCITALGELADSNNPAHQDHVVGISEGSIAFVAGRGDWGDATTSGHIYDQTWSWTPGAEIFLNTTVLSQTAPGVGFVQRIGWAITPTELVVDFAPVSTGPVGPVGPAGPPGPPGPSAAINPTNNYLPYRVNATTFGDSLLYNGSEGVTLYGAPSHSPFFILENLDTTVNTVFYGGILADADGAQDLFRLNGAKGTQWGLGFPALRSADFSVNLLYHNNLINRFQIGSDVGDVYFLSRDGVTTQGRIAEPSGYTGTGTNALTDDGTYKPLPVGSGVKTGTVLLDFGVFPGATEKSVTVLDAGVTAASLIQCWPAIKATADHTADELYLEEFSAEASGMAAGSFVLLARPRRGLSFGRYQFNYLYV